MVIQSPRRLEKRWTRLRKLPAAQLVDLKTDQKMIARQIRQYKLKKDVARRRGHQPVHRGQGQGGEGSHSAGKLLKRALT